LRPGWDQADQPAISGNVVLPRDRRCVVLQNLTNSRLAAEGESWRSGDGNCRKLVGPGNVEVQRRIARLLHKEGIGSVAELTKLATSRMSFWTLRGHSTEFHSWHNRRTTDIGVGSDGTVWVIGPTGVPGDFGIFRWNATEWRQMPGGTASISVGAERNPWIVSGVHEIFNGALRRGNAILVNPSPLAFHVAA
jgi:hypothetical protein